jgi:hypothetical protein
MVAESLIISSEVTGFISFAITILTLLGVYRDLISTLRSADVHIPIILANLRQEILFEKAFISRNLKYADEFHVFPRRLCYVKQPNGQKERTKRAFSMLMDATIKDLWIQFKTLERPFLIRNPMRAEEVRKGDYWDEKDLEEQPKTGSRRRGKIQVRNAEADIRERGKRFYRTDLAHRWIWWQSKGDVDNLMSQVQRVQMRRMERDLFETDELVKRLIRRDGAGSEFGSRSGNSSSSDGGGPRRRNVAGVGVVRSRAGSRAASRAGSVRSVRMPSRRGTTAGRTVREVEEREFVTRPAASPPLTQQSEMEASNTGRRRERRAESRVEYEVLRPGSVYVDVADRPRRTSTYEEDSRGAERRRSYSRERERER